MSSTQFQEKQIELLQKGFKYNFNKAIKTNSIELLAVETELALQFINYDNFQKFKLANRSKNFKVANGKDNRKLNFVKRT